MKALLILSACLILVFGQECPDSTWTRLSDKKRCIKLFTRLEKRDSAQLYCSQTALGYLATIKSAADNEAFAAIAKRDAAGKSSLWLGIHKNVATSTDYQWYDKSPVSYTNWKPGTNPAVTSTTCVIFDIATSQWIPDHTCGSTYMFICQTAAHEHDFRYLIVAEGLDDYDQTEGFAYPSGPSLEAFSATKVVLPLGYYRPSHQILVLMKWRGSASTNITFIDMATDTEIKKYEGKGTVGSWADVILQTHSWFLRMQTYSERKAGLAYDITFTLQPLYCKAEYIDIDASGTGNIQTYGYNRTKAIDRLLSPYTCQKILSTSSENNIYLNIVAYADSYAFVKVIDDATNTEILNLWDHKNYNWVTMKNVNTYAQTVRIEAASAVEGLVGFSIDYFTMPKKCKENSYIIKKAWSTNHVSTKYSMPLSDYSCTTTYKGDTATKKFYFTVKGEVSGDGKISFVSADTGALFKEYKSADGNATKLDDTFYAEAGHDVKIQASAGKDGYFYHSINVLNTA